MNAPVATIDFESRSLCDISTGSYIYSRHGSTQVYRLSYKLPDGTKGYWHRRTAGIPQSHPQRLLPLTEWILAGGLVEAHNAGFEYNMWNNCFRRELPHLPELRLEQLRCSAAKAANMALPRSLDGVTSALEPYMKGRIVLKDMDGKKIMLKCSKPRNSELLKDLFDMGVLAVDEIPWHEDPDDIRAVWAYCDDDVEAEHSFSSVLPDLTDKELELWQMDMRMNLRGVCCDVEGATIARDMAASETARINCKIRSLTEGAVEKGSSRAKLLKWANTSGFAIQNTQADHIKEMIVKCRDDLSATAEGRTVLTVMELCMDVNRTSTKKYVQMIETASADDHRIRDMMLYYGAPRTGRWSGKTVQPHNFLRGFSKEMEFAWEWIHRNSPEDLEFWFGSVMQALAKATRGALVPAPGRQFYVADFAAIEARVLPWLAKDQKYLGVFRRGEDIYLRMAADIYSGDPSKAEFCRLVAKAFAEKDKALLKIIKDRYPLERQMGKKAILGLGFQMGAEKFDDECANDDPPINMPRKFFKQVVHTYRKVSFPDTSSFWDELNETAVRAIENKEAKAWFECRRVAYTVSGGWLHCRLPSGRKLRYFDPRVRPQTTYVYQAMSKQGKPATIRANMKAGQDDPHSAWKTAVRIAKAAEKTLVARHWKDDGEWSETGEQLIERREQKAIWFKGVNQETKRWEWMTTYGGSLAENVTQATARDFMAEAMLRCDQHLDYDVLLSVHDELIAEADDGVGDVREFEDLMAALPDWVPRDDDCPVAAEGWRGKRYKK